MTISGVCKVEFANLMERKAAEGNTKKSIIEQFAKDAGISESTVKKWVYPEVQNRAEKKQTKKRKSTSFGPRLDPDSDSYTKDFVDFKVWKERLNTQLKIATHILTKDTVFGLEEKVIVKEGFNEIDNFLRLYIKKRKDKSLPFK